jgi:uncharacterized membrane protein YgcG
VDAKGLGTQLPLLSTVQPVQVTLPFPFTYYGTTFNSLIVNLSGWASFSSTMPIVIPRALPSTAPGTPANALAVASEQLTSEAGGGVFMYSTSSLVAVEWYLMDGQSSLSTYDCELLLYPNGVFDFQYKTVTPAADTTATVITGIQDGTKTAGLTVAQHPGYLHDGLRVRFSRAPGWLAIDKLAGTVGSGLADSTHMTVDATGLPAGDFTGQVRFLSDDPAQPDVGTAPLALHVGVASTPIDYLTTTITSSVLSDTTTGPLIEARIHKVGTWTFALYTQNLILAERTVPRVSGYFPSTTDWLNVKFPLFRLGEVLTEGPSVMARVMGEIRTKTWFEGVDSLRFVRPTGITPDSIHAHLSTAAAPHFTVGTSIPLGWTPPAGLVGARYDVWLSRNLEANWYAIARDLTTPSATWAVTGAATTTAILGIVVRDTLGLVGSWTSAPFEIRTTGGSGGGSGGSGGGGGGGGGGGTPGGPEAMMSGGWAMSITSS